MPSFDPPRLAPWLGLGKPPQFPGQVEPLTAWPAQIALRYGWGSIAWGQSAWGLEGPATYPFVIGVNNIPISLSMGTPTTTVIVPGSGGVIATLVETFSPEAVGAPGNVAISLTEHFTPEGIGAPGNVAVSLSETFSPEAVGAPGNVAISVTLALTALIDVPATGNVAASLVEALTALIDVPATGNVVVSVL